jgi:oligopeptide/dipeptide ABC transporter ATP-binding protein
LIVNNRRSGEPILSVEGLTTEFKTPDGLVHAVDQVSYDVWPGETLAVVGESGSGKSVTAMSILGLIPQPPGRIVSGRVMFQGRDLLALSQTEIRKVRGKSIAMIFQDPMTSLNPVLTVGYQIAEAMLAHGNISRADAEDRAIALLDTVGVPNPERRFRQFPHQFSGGMRQRALIAMAIANRPRLLIADEPTTALDVTIQAQVFEALKVAQAETAAAMILITHDLGLVAEMADRVVVMYAGRPVETTDVRSLFHTPRHPYTVGLLASLPRLGVRSERLQPITGSPPSLIRLPTGCPFHPRCSLSKGRSLCRIERPPLRDVVPLHRSACHFAEELSPEVVA